MEFLNTKQTYIKFPLKCHGVRRGTYNSRDTSRHAEEKGGGERVQNKRESGREINRRMR